MDSGVYRISNRVNGQSYIGSSTSLKIRLSVHKSTLVRGTHHNKKLQADWIEFGQEMFIFEILEYASGRDVLAAKEADAIQKFQSMECGYNMIPTTAIGGAKQSAEMKEALRLVKQGVNHTNAAAQAGVRRESLQAVLAKLKKEQSK